MNETVKFFIDDYDWNAAFNCAGCDLSDVSEVIAYDEGCNDGPDWIAIVKMKKPYKHKKFAKVFAGCDYTGWD